jgi:hypothetical protein
MTGQVATAIAIRVQAQGGKFLGDDIGGALVTLRDVQTGELLATGTSRGDSGQLNPTYAANASLSTIVTPASPQPSVRWLLALDTTTAFKAVLQLDRPRRVEVEAFGPLGGLQSAQRVAVTTWLVPGQHLTNPPALVLLLPGLLVQVLSPATHTAFPASKATQDLPLEANVTMMCGCPISNALGNPWIPDDFDVLAQIRVVGGTPLPPVKLSFNRAGTPSRFVGTFVIPPGPGPTYYEALITARQLSTGNVGAGLVTFFVQPASG